VPQGYSFMCWADPLNDSDIPHTIDSLYFDNLVATTDTPKIAWGCHYFDEIYEHYPGDGFRLTYSTDNWHTGILTHAWLPYGLGYDSIAFGDSAYTGWHLPDSWVRMFQEIPVAKGTAFSLCWEVLISYYAEPGVQIDYIAEVGLKQGAAVAESKPASAPDYRLKIEPNPFSRATCISYSLPRPGNVNTRLYDVNGALVKTLAEGYRGAGSHTVAVEAGNLARGVYLLRLEVAGAGTAPASAFTKKLVLTR